MFGVTTLQPLMDVEMMQLAGEWNAGKDAFVRRRGVQAKIHRCHGGDFWLTFSTMVTPQVPERLFDSRGIREGTNLVRTTIDDECGKIATLPNTPTSMMRPTIMDNSPLDGGFEFCERCCRHCTSPCGI
jgi:hypothetical protein